MPGDISVEQQDLLDLIKRIKAEDDSKQLRKDFIAEMKPIGEAAAVSVRSGVQALRGLPGTEIIARKVQVQVRTSGKASGVRIRIPRKALDNIKNAPKAFNRVRGIRHPSWGRAPWVTQPGAPYFDDAIRPHLEAARAATSVAVGKFRDRLATRS